MAMALERNFHQIKTVSFSDYFRTLNGQQRVFSTMIHVRYSDDLITLSGNPNRLSVL